MPKRSGLQIRRKFRPSVPCENELTTYSRIFIFLSASTLCIFLDAKIFVDNSSRFWQYPIIANRVILIREFSLARTPMMSQSRYSRGNYRLKTTLCTAILKNTRGSSKYFEDKSFLSFEKIAFSVIYRLSETYTCAKQLENTVIKIDRVILQLFFPRMTRSLKSETVLRYTHRYTSMSSLLSRYYALEAADGVTVQPWLGSVLYHTAGSSPPPFPPPLPPSSPFHSFSSRLSPSPTPFPRLSPLSLSLSLFSPLFIPS